MTAIAKLADQKGKLVADKIKLRAKTWKQVRTELNEKQRKGMRRMDRRGHGGYWNN